MEDAHNSTKDVPRVDLFVRGEAGVRKVGGTPSDERVSSTQRRQPSHERMTRQSKNGSYFSGETYVNTTSDKKRVGTLGLTLRLSNRHD